MDTNYWLRRHAVSRRRMLAIGGTGAAGLAAMLAVGCGDDDDDDTPTATATATSTSSATSTGTASATGTATATASPTQAVTRGGTLQSYRTVDFVRENLTAAAGPAQEFVGLVYAPLLAPKTAKTWQETYGYDIRPDLAATWEQVDDVTYTFKLDPAAKFQQKAPTNGRPVTSDDVIASLKRFIDEPLNTTRADYVALVDSYSAPDAQTVQIKTKTPYAPFLYHLIAFQLFRTYPEELVADDALRTSAPNGSGPFQLKDFREGAYWEFTANPTWHVKENGLQLPIIQALRFNIIPEAAQQVVQFSGKNLDHLAPVPYAMLKQIEGQVKELSVIEAYGTTFTSLQAQQRGTSPFADIKLRQALSMAMDRDALLAIQGNDGAWCNYIGPNMGKWYLDPQGPDAGPNAQYFKHNAAEARAMLEASGQADTTFNFIYTNGYGEAHIQEALVVADQLSQAGFKLRPELQDYRTQFLQAGGKGTWYGEFEGICYGLKGGYPHPYQHFNLNLNSKGTFNTGGWNDPEVDAQIVKLGAEFDDDEQLAITHELERYVMEKQYWSPVITNFVYSLAQPWVQDHRLNNLYQRDAETHMWFKDKPS